MKVCKHMIFNGGKSCSLGLPLNCRTCTSHSIETNFTTAHKLPTVIASSPLTYSTSQSTQPKTLATASISSGCGCKK